MRIFSINMRRLLYLIALMAVGNVTRGYVLTSMPASTSLFPKSLPSRCPSPPCVCNVDAQDRKVVTCVELHQIPVDKMDPETKVINITARPDRPTQVTLGRIFSNLTQLEELHITRSRLPAIGIATFCPQICFYRCSSSLRLLNLTANQISLLQQSDFYCLDNLTHLDLSHNLLSVQTIPSAAFIHLPNLTHLSLAHNTLVTLVPRIFHNLYNLTWLDLSYNPIIELHEDKLSHLRSLEVLLVAGGQLSSLNGITFSELTNLVTIDLRDNHLNYIHPDTFRGLTSLRHLYLSGNRLTKLDDNLFIGLDLNYLDLSRNLLNPLKSCLLCQMLSLRTLNLSHNKLSSFPSNLLGPIAHCLETLYLDYNRNLIDGTASLVSLLQPLKKLKTLSASSIGLDSNLPPSVFNHLGSLVYVNLSANNLTELDWQLIKPLEFLHTLDLSYNKFTFIDPASFTMLEKLKFLSKIYLEGNPFSCYRCQILPMVDWLQRDPSPYWAVCPRLSIENSTLTHCAKCYTPDSLSGRYLHEPNLETELVWCTNPQVQLRLTASEPQVGLILAFLIILSLIAIILVVVAVYRKHGAVYYTQEDKIHQEKIYAARVGATAWSSPNQARLLSLTSSGVSRQNTATMFSPQSSLDTQPHCHLGGELSSAVCETCANSTAVKQVIASMPAMSEMIREAAATSSNTKANGKAPIVLSKKDSVGKENGNSQRQLTQPIEVPELESDSSNNQMDDEQDVQIYI